jgi:hypothetical protein
MPVGIFVHGDAAGRAGPVKAWLKACDFEARDGRGSMEFTADQDEALTFPSVAEALTYWRTVSKTVPRRDDGKPNRPLTAYTVTIQTL